MSNDQDRVRAGLAAFDRVTQERDHYMNEMASARRIADRLQAENESLRAQLHKSDQERTFYMRFATELQTHISDMVEIAHKAITKAKQGAYRPNGPTPPTSMSIAQADDGQPVPRFLTQLEKELSDHNAPSQTNS